MLSKEPIPSIPEACKKPRAAERPDRIARERAERHCETLRRAKSDRPDRACITSPKSTKVKW